MMSHGVNHANLLTVAGVASATRNACLVSTYVLEWTITSIISVLCTESCVICVGLTIIT
jgi:hypothetical protein